MPSIAAPPGVGNPNHAERIIASPRRHRRCAFTGRHNLRRFDSGELKLSIWPMGNGACSWAETTIIHRDLKPANVLLTDDGVPMLLDFNLAHDTKLRDGATSASMGGTLPYMAPEHLQAFHGGDRHVDARSDLYSLGVILFELLTGVSPFATYRKLPMREVVERMIQDRLAGAPRLRPLQKAISPAVEAIILRCLEADPAKRYQTARQLQEDLQRQLEHQPLRHAANPSLWERGQKFRKRHPKLTSMASVAAIASVIIAGMTALFLVREDQRTRFLAARETLAVLTMIRRRPALSAPAPPGTSSMKASGLAGRLSHTTRFSTIPPGVKLARSSICHPSSNNGCANRPVNCWSCSRTHSSWPAMAKTIRRTAPRNFKPVCSFCSLAGGFPEKRRPDAANLVAATATRSTPPAGRTRTQTRKCFEQAKPTDLKNAHDRYLAARLLAEEGKFREALPLLREAIRQNPQDYHLHFLQGICHDYLRPRTPRRSACYRTCIAPQTHGFLRRYYNQAWLICSKTTANPPWPISIRSCG